MSEIHVKENESLDAALKRFKRSCAKAGVLADLRKKEYYQEQALLLILLAQIPAHPSGDFVFAKNPFWS